MMKTIGNDLVRNQLHADRKWYLILGFVHWLRSNFV